MSSHGVADPFLAPSQALSALRLNARKLVDQQASVDFEVQSQLKRQFQLLRRTKKVVDQWVAETNPQFFRHHQQSLVNVRTQLDDLPLHCLLSAMDAERMDDKRFDVCQNLANSQRLTGAYQTFIELLWRAARCDVRDVRFQNKQQHLLGQLQQILERVLEELNFAIDADSCSETRSRWPQWSMPWGQRKTDRAHTAGEASQPSRADASSALEAARLGALRSVLQSNGLNVVGFDQRLCATFTEIDPLLKAYLGALATGEHANVFVRELAKLGKLPAGPLLQQLEAFVSDSSQARAPQGEFSVPTAGKVSRYSWSVQAGSGLDADSWRLSLKRKATAAVESTPPLLQQKVQLRSDARQARAGKLAAATSRSADPLWSEFCNDAATALREMQALAGASGGERRQEGLNNVLAIAHLLRGDASMLGLKTLAEQFAHIEHCAANLLMPAKGDSRSESAAVLGTLIARASVVLDDIRKRKEGALSADVQGVQERLMRFAAVLAKAQGKLAELKVQGKMEVIPKALRMPLLHIWVQWVHNALAHGNEGPMNRQALGKANALQLTLTVRREQDWLDIQCTDDGRGFDFERCRQRLVIEGCAKEIVESLPPSALIDDLLRLRPRDHLRTEQARGMGLAACAELIRGLGGTLQIQTKHQKGVMLHIRIPTK